MEDEYSIHEHWMQHALMAAEIAFEKDEVPVGAIVVEDDRVIGQGFNRNITDKDPSAHAEIVALRDAALRKKNHRLTNATIYVTVEPCAMCAGAIVQARLKAVVFGARDAKAGAAGSVLNVLQNSKLNHQCEVIGGVLEGQCAEIIQEFFLQKRARDSRKGFRDPTVQLQLRM